jgi:PhnB protein
MEADGARVRRHFTAARKENPPMHVQPYLHFDGHCEEAIAFYRHALGAELEMLMRYQDSPEPPPPGTIPPGMERAVMHASFRIGDSVIMASDDCTRTHTGFQGFQLSLAVADAAEAERRFTALAAGGEVRVPLTATFFSPRFGMVTDRFGVAWIVLVREHAPT